MLCFATLSAVGRPSSEFMSRFIAVAPENDESGVSVGRTITVLRVRPRRRAARIVLYSPTARPGAEEKGEHTQRWRGSPTCVPRERNRGRSKHSLPSGKRHGNTRGADLQLPDERRLQRNERTEGTDSQRKRPESKRKWRLFPGGRGLSAKQEARRHAAAKRHTDIHVAASADITSTGRWGGEGLLLLSAAFALCSSWGAGSDP